MALLGRSAGGFALHAGLSIILALVAAIIVVGLPGSLSAVYSGCPGGAGSGLPEVRVRFAAAAAQLGSADRLSLFLCEGQNVPERRDRQAPHA
jgi:hypothetical protein